MIKGLFGFPLALLREVLRGVGVAIQTCYPTETAGTFQRAPDPTVGGCDTEELFIPVEWRLPEEHQ